MSRCPWSETIGAASRPGVAGTRMTRLRPASWLSSRPCSAAQARTCSITGSSCREGRGIRVRASKCAQNADGSSPARTAVSVMPASAASGEGLLLQRLELGLRDGAGVEQLLGPVDLGRRAAPAPTGGLTDVVVELVALRAGALEVPLGHAHVLRDEVDEDAEERQQDREDDPARLAQPGEVVPAEDVREDGEQEPEPQDPDEEDDH